MPRKTRSKYLTSELLQTRGVILSNKVGVLSASVWTHAGARGAGVVLLPADFCNVLLTPFLRGVAGGGWYAGEEAKDQHREGGGKSW